MTKGETKNKIVMIGVSAFVLIFMIISAVTIIKCINGFGSSEKSSLVNDMKSNVRQIDEILKRGMSVVESTAAAFYDFNEYRESDAVKEMLLDKLAHISEKCDFDDIMLIDTDGLALSCKYDRTEHKGMSYFDSAIRGSACISAPVPIADGSTLYNVYSAPIRDDNGEIVGVCAAFHDSSLLSEEIKSFLSTSGEANVLVANNSGKVIIEIDRTLPLEDLIGPDGTRDSNVFTGSLAGYIGDSDFNKIKSDFTLSDVSGELSFKTGDREYYIYYSDIPSISDLNCFSVADMQSVTGQLGGYLSMSIAMYILYVVTVIVIIGEYFTVQRVSINRLKAANDGMKKSLYVDPITGYSTWNKFNIDAGELIKSEYLKYALVSFDIDKFKTFNDIYGHDEGNRMLKKIADTLNNNTDDHETFARINSDLFYILMKFEGNEAMVERIKGLISSIEYEFTDFIPVLSFGIYKINNKNLSFRRMGDCADIARRTIKYHDQSGYEFFFDDMLERIRQEKIIENDMQMALDTDEFIVYYQPKVLLNGTARLKGAEALVRWIKDGALVPPGSFIPLFERNRFVLKLDYYVMDKVCGHIARWMQQGKNIVLVSVNMSRLHLNDPDFTQRLEDICNKHGVPTSMIEIEITESAASFDNMALVHKVFKDLKQRGFVISIDDFGSGYSSLNMLKDLPVDVLKIDREFLTDDVNENIRANEIIGHVIQLAQALGIETICEGIENEHQVELLRGLGCDMAQGFFYARPMPVEDFENVLDRHSI